MLTDYQGPGFYDENGARVCSLHPDAMMWFIETLGYARIDSPSDFGQFSNKSERKQDEHV